MLVKEHGQGWPGQVRSESWRRMDGAESQGWRRWGTLAVAVAVAVAAAVDERADSVGGRAPACSAVPSGQGSLEQWKYLEVTTTTP